MFSDGLNLRLRWTLTGAVIRRRLESVSSAWLNNVYWLTGACWVEGSVNI